MANTSESSEHKDLEKRVYESLHDAGRIIPTSLEDIEKAESRFADESIQLPERLRNPMEVLQRIKGDVESEPQRLPQVFGQLLQMLRIKHKLSHTQLADRANVDVQELLLIESDDEYTPKPRTVSLLAKYFRIVPKNLARVANLTSQSNDRVFDGAVQFAASSNRDFEKLSWEQKRALKAFLRILNKSK